MAKSLECECMDGYLLIIQMLNERNTRYMYFYSIIGEKKSTWNFIYFNQKLRVNVYYDFPVVNLY